jgi:hypothetical protein
MGHGHSHAAVGPDGRLSKHTQVAVGLGGSCGQPGDDRGGACMGCERFGGQDHRTGTRPLLNDGRAPAVQAQRGHAIRIP